MQRFDVFVGQPIRIVGRNRRGLIIKKNSGFIDSLTNNLLIIKYINGYRESFSAAYLISREPGETVEVKLNGKWELIEKRGR